MIAILKSSLKLVTFPAIAVALLYAEEPQNPVMPGGDTADEVFDFGRGTAAFGVALYSFILIGNAVYGWIKHKPSGANMGALDDRLKQMNGKLDKAVEARDRLQHDVSDLERNTQQVYQTVFGVPGVPTTLTLVARVDKIHERLDQLNTLLLRYEDTVDALTRRIEIHQHRLDDIERRLSR